jgi:hypothetical protein
MLAKVTNNFGGESSLTAVIKTLMTSSTNQNVGFPNSGTGQSFFLPNPP